MMTHLHFIPQSSGTKTRCFVLLSSSTHHSTLDLVCMSRSAVSIRREGKAKRLQLTAITQLTTSRPTWRSRPSFGHATSSSCYERTSESSFPALHTCPLTPAHNTHTQIRQSWFEQRWKSWRATSTGESRKCCSTLCSVLTMSPSCLSALLRWVSLCGFQC